MDKMREEFEAWATNVYGTARMGFSAGFYSRDEVQWAWQAWQASRKALVVELPTTWNASFTEKVIVMDADSVVEALDTAGVAYK